MTASETTSGWMGRGRHLLSRLAGRRPEPPRTRPAPTRPTTTAYERLLAEGASPAVAATSAAREGLGEGDLPGAIRLGMDLLATPATAQTGRAVLGLARYHTCGPATAWAELTEVTDPDVLAASTPELAICGLGPEPERVLTAYASLVDSRPHLLDAAAALTLAQHAFSVGGEPLSRRIADLFDAGAFGEASEHRVREMARLRTWFADGSQRAPVPVLEADLRLGVLDYRQPDVASRNVGDYIQTLASIGHIVRHQGLRYVGEPGLVGLLEELSQHVKPERQRTAAAATVQLVEVQRDGSVYQDLPEPTWALMFGWFLHHTFSGGYNLPLHPALRPILISFHLNKPDALTPAAIAYLTEHGPVGCRDWQSVAVLRSAGVPAFFSGCLTTTVDTLYPRVGPDTRSATAYVDDPRGPEEAQLKQTVTAMRTESLVTNLRTAAGWVRRYHEEFETVRTPRLHAYLPARSVGCRVDFNPKNPCDVRFGGLIDIDDAAFDAIRDGILDKTGAIIELLATGADEATVRARWRELCAPDVAAADAHLSSLGFGPGDPVTIPLDLPAGTDRVIVIDAFASAAKAARLVSGLAEHAVGVPVLVVAPADGATLPDPAPEGVALVRTALGRHAALAGVLAGLPTGSRALLLPADAIVRGSLDDLFGLDLGGRALAAPVDVRRARHTLSVLIRRLSARQHGDWRRALGFAAAAHGRSPHGRPVADARVGVVDVDALRATDWPRLVGPLVDGHGLSLSEALSITLGGDVVELPPTTVCSVALQRLRPEAVVVSGLGQAALPARLVTRERS